MISIRNPLTEPKTEPNIMLLLLLEVVLFADELPYNSKSLFESHKLLDSFILHKFS